MTRDLQQLPRGVWLDARTHWYKTTEGDHVMVMDTEDEEVALGTVMDNALEFQSGRTWFMLIPELPGHDDALTSAFDNLYTDGVSANQ